MKSAKAKSKLTTALLITAIAVGGLLVGGSGGFLIGHYAKPANVDMGNLNADDLEDSNDNLLTKYEKCKQSGKDPVSEFPLSDLANISIQKLLSRQYFAAYGFGNVFSVMNIDICNVNIKNGDNSFEESVSMGNGIVNVRVAQRDYMRKDGISSHLGNIGENLNSITWGQEPTEYTHEAYSQRFGKLPNTCFNYIVSSKTVLPESSINQVEGGYSIHLQLDTVGAVVRYIRRMMNLSGSQVSQFYDIQFTLNVDNDFNLITSTIDETYSASMANVPAKCNGRITTYYVLDEESTIPSVDESVNYTDIAEELGI